MDVGYPICARVIRIIRDEVDTTLQIHKNVGESVFHVRVGRARAARPVRIADHLIVEVDRQNHLAGLWLHEVPPFPNIESGD